MFPKVLDSNLALGFSHSTQANEGERNSPRKVNAEKDMFLEILLGNVPVTPEVKAVEKVKAVAPLEIKGTSSMTKQQLRKWAGDQREAWAKLKK